MPAPHIIDFPYQPNATALFNAVRDLPAPIWFDSGKPRSLQGRFDIISASPIVTIETEGQTTRISNHQSGSKLLEHSTDKPFTIAERVLEEMGSIANESGLPFCGGLAGYFGYDAGQQVSLCDGALIDLAESPDLRLGYYTWALIINHQTSKAWTVFHPACSDALKKDVLARLTKIDGNKPENRNSESTNSANNNSANNKHKNETNFALSTGFKASISRDAY
ncbi:MAG: hypothetical protein KUG71_13205, partial [Porticoccaceae bacterium]|nr:hypothetical protein [Porticoccaceae bacterium]